MVKKKTCVFISGKGSNLRSLIKFSRDYSFPISVNLIVTNNRNAKGLNYAKINSIPYLIIDVKKRNYELKILDALKKNKISLICLAGYMKIISKRFISEFRKKIINIHPSLLPKFKGLNTYERILKKKEKRSGCTVHYIDEKLDNGKIILQKFFFIQDGYGINELKKKTQSLEYKSFSEALIRIYRYTNFWKKN